MSSIVVATVVLTKPHKAAAKDGPVRTTAGSMSFESVAGVMGAEPFRRPASRVTG